MYKKFLISCFFAIFTLAAIVLYSGHTHEIYPFLLDGSVHAEVHGSTTKGDVVELGVTVHIHGIAYAHIDRAGNYTLALTVDEAEDADWGREKFQGDILKQGSYKTGLRVEKDITFYEDALRDTREIAWTASSTVVDNVGKVTHRDYKEKEAGKFGENEDIDNSPYCDNCTNGCSACPTPGIYPTDPNQTPSPGDTYSVHLITDGPYSKVYWYVKAPWETTSLGTNVETDSGNGTATTASLNYTFPSGAMHTGDFKITAYIYASSGSVYEYSYTVAVSLD